MKTHFVRFLALLLICATFSSAALTVSAAEVAPRASGQTSGLPFTLIPDDDVDDLYTSNRSGGYNFVPGRVSGSTIKVSGNFTHSSSSGTCRAGICYYSSGYKTPEGGAGEARSGRDITASIPKERLDQDRTYYGFVKNVTGTGYISSGSVTIFTA